MGDENHIRTLGDYSKSGHEGYKNTIKLPVENNMVPLRSNTIRLVQNGCSFHGLWSEDLNQHLKNCMEDPKQAFVEYAFSRFDEVGRNFTYVIDLMIIEDISSIIDPRLSQVVLGRYFVEISNMTHDPREGVGVVKLLVEVPYDDSVNEALDKFKVFKTEVELQQGSLIKRFRTGRGDEYMDTLYFQYVGIIYETTAPYTPQQIDVSIRKNRVLKETVNFMLSYSGLSQGFWGEAMLTTYYILNRVPNNKNRITPYKLWNKTNLNLNYLRVWGCRAVVRLLDPKLKILGERGIECIFVGYAEHFKAFRFFVIEPNDSVSINSIIESRDAIFNENIFSSIPIPCQRSLVNGTKYIGGSVVTEEVVQQSKLELRKSKRNRTPKDFGPEFQLYLIEWTMDEVSNQHFYCFNVDDDPKTFDEAIKSQDVAFWKEAINDEIESIMGNHTWGVG
uniref:Zinc finger, CCHC-type n=1 Tax=Tanacetum cinerariifolium TaxID=118510 RepID=A0A699GV31_TANCI|nr:zinc finger, CCHC-type [Tanacetum cinerariifolium]